jgi:hypothetical protein
MYSDEEKIKIGLYYNTLFQNLLKNMSEEDLQILGCEFNIIEGVGILQVRELPFPFLNCTCGLGFQKPVTEEGLKQIINQFESYSRVPFTLRVSENFSKPENLNSILATKFKFSKKGNFYCFMRSLDNIPDKKSNLIIKEINNLPEYHEIFLNILDSSFEIPDPHSKAFRYFSKLLLSSKFNDSYKNYLAFDKDVPISTATVYIDKKERIAWLGNAATLKEHRGKGGQGDLVVHRLQTAKEYGCKFATVETGDKETDGVRNPSYHNILRYGFEEAIEYSLFFK